MAEIKYTITHLDEIINIFTQKEYFNNLYDAFYNGQKNNKHQKDLKNEVISTAKDLKTAIKDKNEEEISRLTTTLTSLLTKFISESTVKAEENSDNKDYENWLNKSLKQTSKNIDKLTKVFDYNDSKDQNNYAYKIVNESEAETKKLFSNLTAYNALAKKHFDSGYVYKSYEEDAIISVLGKDYLPDKNGNIKKALPSQELHDGLKKAYDQVKDVEWVKSANRTSYLKSSGWHGKNFATSALVAGGVLGVGLATTLPGAPLQGGSFASLGSFILTQIGVLAASIGIGTASGAIRQGIMNSRSQKMRNQVRKIKNKEEFFKLVRANQPTKGKSLSKCIKDFEKEAQKKGFDIKLGKGLRRRNNYRFLIEASNEKLLRYGCGKRDIRKLNKIAKKGQEFNRGIQTNSSLNELAEALSKNNPLTTLLGIKGTKKARKGTGTKEAGKAIETVVYAPAKEIENSKTNEKTMEEPPIATPSKEKGEGSESKAKSVISKEDKSNMKKMLEDNKSKCRTFTIEVKSKEAQIEIKINKGKAKGLLSRAANTLAIIPRIEKVSNEMIDKEEATPREDVINGVTVEYKVTKAPKK